jgi:galactose mutarotase-like enzyme
MITEQAYKDVRAVVLENERLRVAVLPGHGAKVASLVYKPLQRELLWQNPSPTFIQSNYGDPYTAGDLAGFDEMFPTISECGHPTPPWRGIVAPDHGEVWALPWDCRVEGETVTLTVCGVRFPYRLSKTLALEGACLRGRYEAENLCPLPFDFIWAAHPLFNAEEGMELIVPAGLDAIVNSVPGPTLGGYGARHRFPVASRPDGTAVALNRVPQRNATGYQKYYFAGRAPEGWCLLRDAGRDLTIGLSYPKETVPYLGIWLNEGGYAGQYNVAPEPASAAMDRLDAAALWGTGSLLGPRERRRWVLNLAVAEGPAPRRMTEEGRFV